MVRLKICDSLLVAWLAVFFTMPALATEPVGTMRFEVVRDGHPIGEHVLTFVMQPDGNLEVDIDINLDVKFGPFTIFSYQHRNRTTWRDRRLIKLDSETNDNGKRHWVRATATVGGLTITSDQDARTEVSAATLPTTYWMASTVRQDQLINTQTGEILDVVVRRVGREAVDSAQGSITTTRYRMNGDLEIDLWYDDVGVLVGMAFVARGSQITYRLLQQTGKIPVSIVGDIKNGQR